MNSTAPQAYLDPDDEEMSRKMEEFEGVTPAKPKKKEVTSITCPHCNKVSDASRSMCVWCGRSVEYDPRTEFISSKVDEKLLELNGKFLTSQIPDFETKFREFCIREKFDMDAYVKSLLAAEKKPDTNSG